VHGKQEKSAYAGPAFESAFAKVMLLLAITMALYSIALTVHSYMPCPFWDEWKVIGDIADGATPWSLHWLWSQHSEHRIASTRLLIWLDWAAFGGKNVSLFVEMYLVQLVQWGAICWVLERLTPFPKSLKLTLQGLFAFCLFHPNQIQNFTWAFQISFFLPFALGTIALLAVTFFDRAPWRWRWSILIGAGFAPIIAATSLASGLLIGPALVCLAFLKRLPGRAVLALSALSLLSIVVYFAGFRIPTGHSSPIQWLSRPVDVFRYMVTYFDASWPLFSCATLSFLCFLAFAIFAAFHRDKITDFEWFCIAECGLMLATALMTACARLQYGILQAAESRYQTPAMIYWASLFSILLVAIWRMQPTRFKFAQFFVLLISSSSLLQLPPLAWEKVWADSKRRACAAVISGHYDAQTARQLTDSPEGLKRGAQLLRQRWRTK
jgi:hypothetical protein